jgi:hypothetical protein
MLEQLRNGMGAGNGWRRGELRRSLSQEFGERGSVPGVFDCGSAVGIGDLLGASHGWSSLHFRGMLAHRKMDRDAIFRKGKSRAWKRDSESRRYEFGI